MYLNISHIYLQNFQSIRGPVKIDFSPITMLYGPNSAGKSAVYDAIKIALIHCHGKDLDDFDYYSAEESVTKFMHNHNFTDKMVIGIGASFHIKSYYDPPALKGFELCNFFPSLSALFDDAVALPIGNWEIRFTFGFSPVGNEKIIGSEYVSSVEYIEIYESNQLVLKLDIGKIKMTGQGCIAINLLHPLVKKINSSITEDGSSLQDLCAQLIVSDQLVINDAMILICGVNFGSDDTDWVPQEKIFYWLGHPYYEETIASPSHQKLEIILQYLILSPLRNLPPYGDTLSRIGPLRIIPKNEDLHFFSIKTGFVKRPGWYTVPINKRLSSNDDGYNAWIELASGKTVSLFAEGDIDNHETQLVLEIVNKWLSSKDRLNLGYAIEVITREINDSFVSTNGKKILWRDQPTNAERAGKVSFIKIIHNKLGLSLVVHDVGVGIAQLIPILVAGLTNLQTFIEQPELHLHPMLQMQIADYFASTWNSAKHRFIIETHSEYMALRLLRRIRETARDIIDNKEYSLKPEDLSFYYFDAVDGVTEIKKLRTTPAGEFLDRWPKGFFAEREGELFDDID